MKKSELAKLRTLNVTKTIKDILQLKPKAGECYTPYGRKADWMYEIAARCQQLSGYLKVSIFKREDVFNQIIAPRWDIFIDYNGYQYITRERQKDGSYKWRECMADNLEKNWFWGNRSSINYCYMSYENRRTIKSLLETKEDGFTGIVEWQKACRKKKADLIYAVHKKKWAQELAGIKELPKGFDNWWHKEAFSQHYIFYNLKDDRYKGMCTYCQSLVEFKKELTGKLHKSSGMCPSCKKNITFISRGIRRKSICSYFERVGCLQSFKGGLILREFNVKRKDYLDKDMINRSEFYLWECRRTIINDRKAKTYVYDDYKNRGVCWMEDPYRNVDKGYIQIYPRNMNILLKSFHSSYPIAQEYGYKEYRLMWFLKQEKAHPIIEQLYKAGICRLASEIVNYPVCEIDIDYSESNLAKKLGIDNARMKRLKEMDGNSDTLYWLRREKAENTQYRDSDIKTLTMLGIGEYEYKKNAVFKYLSISKICNYLDKQVNIRGGAKGVNIYSIWRDWNDYINMMIKAKMDLTKEILLKPKDLILAHNELTARLSKDANKNEIKARKKKYKAAEQLMNSGELKKYEYEDDKYQIVAPNSIDDIYHEGIILKHCIHTCEIYFGRIDIKESYLMFLRRKSSPDTPWYTLEIEPGGNIRQKKSVLNEAYDDLEDAIPFLEKWQKWVNENLSKEDQELAKKSNQARIEGYKKLRDDKKVIWHGRLQGTLLVDALESDFMAV